MLKNPTNMEGIIRWQNSSFLPHIFPASLLDSSAGRTATLVDESVVTPVDIIPPWISILIYQLGMINRPVDSCSSETWSHPINMEKHEHA
jgi:hypothetical protein